jgi:hypothetical protein
MTDYERGYHQGYADAKRKMMDKPEFTVPYERLPEGMTLRDYFAGLAMQGMMARDVFDGGQARPEQRAKLAYIEADAMMKAKNEVRNP